MGLLHRTATTVNSSTPNGRYGQPEGWKKRIYLSDEVLAEERFKSQAH